MTSFVSQALAFAFATPSAASTLTSAPLAWGLVILALSLGALWWRARGQLQASAQELARLAKAQAADKSKGALQQQLESSRAALKAAEVALAVQKKKNFQHIALLQAAQQEAEDAGRRANATIESAKRAQRDAEAARRLPSRANQAKPRSDAQAAAPQPQAPAAQDEPAAAAPSPAAQAAADHSAVPNAVSSPNQSVVQSAEQSAEKTALTEALFAAEAARATIEAQSLELREALKDARRQMSRKDKRIEDLRRLDLMSRGKVEVLEDKLKRLGRELYETISTLAQLRGEVGPVPGPKQAKGARSAQPRAARSGEPSRAAQMADARPEAPADARSGAHSDGSSDARSGTAPSERTTESQVPAHIAAAQHHTPQASTPSAP